MSLNSSLSLRNKEDLDPTLDNSSRSNDDSSPQSPMVSPERQFVESCPPTPSPRSLRKSSLKSIFTLSLNIQQKTEKGDSSQNPSPNNNNNNDNNNNNNNSPRTSKLLHRASLKLAADPDFKND